MSTILRSFAAGVLLILAPSLALAQSADPSGHWTGVIKAPSGDIAFGVDFARGSDGAYAGELSMPGEQLKGLPLQRVVVNGRSIEFSARTDQQFAGSVSADGASITGELTVPEGSVPVSLTRHGEAHLDGPVTSAHLPAELEGVWDATLTTDEGSMRIVLTMTNKPDGTALAHLDNEQQGHLRMPVRVTQHASSVTIDSPIFNGSFTGTVNADGAAIAGTYTQAAFSAPLTFRKAR